MGLFKKLMDFISGLFKKKKKKKKEDDNNNYPMW